MNNNLKDNIYELLKAKGISVRKLEHECGFGNRTISAWNENKPSIDRVQKVADYFGVTVDYLLGNTIDEEVINIRKQLRERPEAKTLLDATRKCTPEEIIALTEMIEKWKK